MGKGANKNLMSTGGVAGARGGQQYGKGNQLYGWLEPAEQQQYLNPQGYSPQQMGAMNTASQESTGGSVGGATGQANLEAARTRNAGGFQGAVSSSARSAGRNLATNALDVQMAQANLQQQQKAQALQSLQGLYGMDMNQALSYLNASTSAYSAENAGSNNNPWNRAFAGATGQVIGNALTLPKG
jgi:hypothetical protein